MKPALAIFSLLLSAGAVSAADDEKAVRAAVDQFNDAARKGDETTLNRLLADGLVYGHSSAKIENKGECVKALVKGKPNFTLNPGWTVQLYGKTAVVHGLMNAVNMQDGKPVTIKLDLLQVWVKDGNQWRLAARHTTRVTT